MLYILAGASNSGKSQIARYLTNNHKIPYFSLDLLTSIFSEKKTLDISHATPVEKRASALWKFTYPLASHITKEIDRYILEGDAILPQHVAQLQKEFPKKILSVFLGYSQIDPKKKLQLIRDYEHLPDSWTHLFTDEDVLKFINTRVKYSKHLKEKCKKYNIPYIEVGDNLEEVYSQVRKKLKLRTSTST